MFRKRKQKEIDQLTRKIQVLEARRREACYASATGLPHEDMLLLFIEKDKLVERKIKLTEEINKPFLQIITGR